MPHKDPEKRAAYNREYREKNRERLLAQKKQRYENNKEEERARQKEYGKTPQCKKSYRISSWKQLGLIHDDYGDLYDKYLASTHCEECGVEYGEFGCGKGTWKCMDHCHVTGEFRNFLCCKCNLNRR